MWPTHIIPLLDKAGREAWCLKCGLDPQHQHPWELTRNADSESPQVHEILMVQMSDKAWECSSRHFFGTSFLWFHLYLNFFKKCLKSSWYPNWTDISCITLENLLNILEPQFPTYKIAIIPTTPYFFVEELMRYLSLGTQVLEAFW